MITHEFAFKVDEFGDPVVFKDSECIMMNLVHLLLLEPGTFQSHPEMGVGLVSKYRYMTDDKIQDLKDDFQAQIEKYLPQYQAVDIQVALENMILLISTKINGSVYGFFYNSETNDLKTAFKRLEDL